MPERRLVPTLADAQVPVTASVTLPLAQMRARLERKLKADGAAFRAGEPLAQPE